MLASIRNTSGDVISDYAPTSKPILDPRVAYLTTSLMENVINHGTAAGVRSLGFSAPAAGKTGTSNDAWFAGYTSNLLCIVWVGNDDYTDIKMDGAKAAAPIWAAFMKRAVALPQYSDTKNFDPPTGVTEVQLDKATNLISDTACPEFSRTGCSFWMARNRPTPAITRTATSETFSRKFSGLERDPLRRHLYRHNNLYRSRLIP